MYTDSPEQVQRHPNLSNKSSPLRQNNNLTNGEKLLFSLSKAFNIQ